MNGAEEIIVLPVCMNCVGDGIQTVLEMEFLNTIQRLLDSSLGTKEKQKCAMESSKQSVVF